MSPQDVRDRLGDRFRLLAGARRGLERHQTLRHAVQWSYDLLDDDERAVLDRCSVFADGFDLAAATHSARRRPRRVHGAGPVGLAGPQVARHRRADGRPHPLRAAGDDPPVRRGATRRHRHDRRGPGPSRRATSPSRPSPTGTSGTGPTSASPLDWVDVELANLRAGFRWAADRGRPRHGRGHRRPHRHAGWALQRFEPVGWAEEILAAATDRRPAPTPPPVHRRQPLLVHRTRRRRPSATPRPRSRWRPIPATTRSTPVGAAFGSRRHIYAGRARAARDLRGACRPDPGSRTSSACAGCSTHLPARRAGRGGHSHRGRRPCGGPRPRQPLLDRLCAPWYGRAFTEPTRPGPERPARRARLHPGAPAPATGRRSSHEKPPASKRLHGDSTSPRPLRHRHRFLPSGRQRRPTAGRRRLPGRVLRPVRSDPRSPPPSTAPAPTAGSTALGAS